MRFRILAALASVGLCFFGVTSASAAPHPVAPTVHAVTHMPGTATDYIHSPNAAPQGMFAQRAAAQFDIANSGSGLCWRDPSDGGPGTFLLNSTCGTSNAQDWNFFLDSSRCNGAVTSTCPGGWISSHLLHAQVVEFPNVGEGGDCGGANASSSWDMTVHTCDSSSSSNISTAFAYASGTCPDGTNNNEFFSFSKNSSTGYIASYNTNNTNLVVGTGGGFCTDGLWGFVNS